MKKYLVISALAIAAEVHLPHEYREMGALAVIIGSQLLEKSKGKKLALLGLAVLMTCSGCSDHQGQALQSAIAESGEISAMRTCDYNHMSPQYVQRELTAPGMYKAHITLVETAEIHRTHMSATSAQHWFNTGVDAMCRKLK